MKENYEYRNQAKQLMVGRYGVVIITIILLAIIIGVPETISESFRPKYEVDWETFERTVVDPGNPALAYLFSIVAYIFSAVVAYATARMFIQVSNDETPQMENILKVGFVEQPIRSVVHTFIVSIFVMLWTLLLIIPGIMAAYKYTMGFYIMNKEQDISAYDAVSKSKAYMMGYRMKLFMLDLSYLLWYLIGIFTLFILWLWIIPKHSTARTLFFNDLYLANNPIPNTVEEEF